MNNKKENVRGITLIALVVTIIVLLILAGVTMSLILGENGIITKANEGKDESVIARADEQAGLIAGSTYIGKYEGKTFEQSLNNARAKTSFYVVSIDGEVAIIKDRESLREYEIYWDGNYIYLENGKEIDVAASYPEIEKWIPIYTRAQLEKVGSGQKETIDGTEHTFSYGINIGYILKNDIDLSGKKFIPLPGLGEGVFCGNNKTIKNINIEKDSIYTGLFLQNRGEISNLIVEGKIIGNNYVGAIAGANYGIIKSCYNIGEVTGSDKFVGGIAGYSNGVIENSYNTGGITGNRNIGGIVGSNSSNGAILRNCYNTGEVIANGEVGGIAGHNTEIIENSYNTGDITGKSSSYTGGIVGINGGGIENCYNIGKIRGNGQVGGIAGFSSGVIENGYNIGDITGNGSFVGGIVGLNGGTINNCYYLQGTSSAMGVSKTSEELKEIYDTLGNQWKKDTNNIINNGYPILIWQ